MAIKYPIILSVTDPNNNIGLLKVRQADEESQTLVVQILEDAVAKSYEGLQVFFCARIGQTAGLGIIEQKLNVSEMTEPKNGKLEYTFRAEDWQVLGRQTGYFSFRKMKDDHTYEQQFSTRDFTYEVTKSIYSDGIKEVTRDGSTYVWTIEDLKRLYEEYIASGKSDWEEFVEQNKEIIESVDPGGQVLSELIRARKPADAESSYPDLPSRLDQQIGLNSDFRPFEQDKSFMQRVFNENSERKINVKWFGATGDGVTDDTSAIQQAIGHAANFGGIVYFPRGEYLYTQLIISGSVTLQGGGTQTSVLISDRETDCIITEDTEISYWFKFQKLALLFPNITGRGVYITESLRYSFEECKIEGAKESLSGTGIFVDGSNHAYYGDFRRTQISYFDIGVSLNDSANAHMFYSSTFYFVNTGIEINNSNGIVIIGTTIQDFMLNGIKLFDNGKGLCNRNLITGCYIEAKSGSEPSSGINIGANVKSTVLLGNLYNGLRPKAKEVNDLSKTTTRLEYGATSTLETMKLPQFTQLITMNKDQLPIALKEYKNSFSFAEKDGELSSVKSIIMNEYNTPVWIDMLYVYNRALVLPNGTTIVGGSLKQYADDDILLGTKSVAEERRFNYDNSFKMPRYHDGSGWRYIQGVRSGHTNYRPENAFVGYEYYDTALKKPIWYDGSNWRDAMSNIV